MSADPSKRVSSKLATGEQDMPNTTAERKVTNLPQLSPSDPSFDRSRLGDSDYIELLLFETKELKSTISEFERRIEHLVAKFDRKEEFTAEDFTGSKSRFPEPRDDIPQRSARRRKQSQHEVRKPQTSDTENKRESVASITSNGPIDIENGVLLSESFKTELSEAISTPRTPHLTLTDPEESAANETESPLSPTKLKQKKLYGIEDQSEYEQLAHDSSIVQEEDLMRNSYRIPSGSGSYKSRIRLPERSRQPDPPSEDEALSDVVPRRTDVGNLQKEYPNISSPSTPEANSTDAVSASSSLITSNSSSMAGLNNNTSTSTLPRTPDTLKTPLGGDQVGLDVTRAGSTGSTPTSYLSQRKGLDLTSPSGVNALKSSESLVTPHRPASQTPGSSFQVLNGSGNDEVDVPLFIQPADFYTIKIKVVSTITTNAKKADDPNCTFSINDKDTDKEMWRIRKSFSQISAFDKEIRPVLEFFGLPFLPEKSVFNSTTPMKVDSRMRALQDYFDTIFVIPHVPQAVLHRICRYISLDFVNPLDDFKSGARKEGFLIRRYKGLGTSWKTRWCSIDGPVLEVYDSPGGSLIEQIKLFGSQIGRQSSDVVAEERGYRHAFLILESSKSSKISGSFPKHFFCAESDKERDDWIAAMVEFTENDPLNNPDNHAQQEEKGHHSSVTASPYVTPSPAYTTDHSEHLSHEYSVSSPYTKSFPPEILSEDNDLKESKKTKMRSIFPFRSKSNQEENSHDSRNQLSQQKPTESTMSSYLESMNLSEEPAKAVFGRDLAIAFNLSNINYNGLQIPSVCFRCLDFLNRTGAIYEEGIFRLSGSASTIRQLKEKFNSHFDYDLFDSDLKPDINTVAGLFKTYLRELPEPIFGVDIYNGLQRLMAGAGSDCSKSKLSVMMKNYLNTERRMDMVHHNVCVAIFGYLKSVIAKSSINKMSLKNLCIVFVPTLNISVEVLSHCLIDFDCIFGNSNPVDDQFREVLDLQIPVF